MIFNIDTFRTSTRRQTEGFAKPSKFTFIAAIPPGLIGGEDNQFIWNAARYIQWKVDAVTFPNVALRPHAIRRYGYGPLELKPWESLFNPIKITVLCGGLGEEWSFFNRWVNLVLRFRRGYNVASDTDDDPFPVSGVFQQDAYEVSYKSDYATQIEIRTYRDGPIGDKSQDPTQEILRVVLREAYPLSIESMTYDWADTRKIQEFNVNIVCFDWYQEILPAQKLLGATNRTNNGLDEPSPGL